MLRLCLSAGFELLRTVRDSLHDTPDRHGAAVQHAALHRLLAHCVASVSGVGGDSLPQHTGVACQPSDSDTDVVVDLDQLLLVGCELARRALEREEDGVGFGPQSDGGGALLHGLEGVLDLVELALRRLG